MADIKTHLRELSVAITIGLLKKGINFNLTDLYDSERFFKYAKNVINGDISSAENIKEINNYTGELKQIIDNGVNLGMAIFEDEHFSINENTPIEWLGNDTQKDDPIDIQIGDYGFSLKEESFILENMGLYKLLNCYTGSKYKKRHIFNDYARQEYEEWFSITWNELLDYLNKNDNTWCYINTEKKKQSVIKIVENEVVLMYYHNGKEVANSILPLKCKLLNFEKNTTSNLREQVFAKFINLNLKNNKKYNDAKIVCAKKASDSLAKELNSNLNYNSGLPRFLRIHNKEYFYAKTTSAGIEIFKVPSINDFGDVIYIDSIKSSVPNKQANILTTIVNRKTNKKLVLRNECRFSHGQFNGTPEAKMYYEQGGSLEVIYEKIR